MARAAPFFSLLGLLLLSATYAFLTSNRHVATLELPRRMERLAGATSGSGGASKPRGTYGPAARVRTSYSPTQVQKVSNAGKKLLQALKSIVTAPFRLLLAVCQTLIDNVKARLASKAVPFPSSKAKNLEKAQAGSGKVVNKVAVDRDAEARRYVEAKLKEIDQKMKEHAEKLRRQREPGRWPPTLAEVPPSTRQKRSVADLKEADLKGKRVLVRCDLNVPLIKGVITDDTRIRGSLSTIQYLVKNGAKVLITSHLGRPKGGYEAKFSLAPIAPRLSELLQQEVKLVPDCIGMAVEKAVMQMKDGEVVLLENSRFYPEEEANSKAFSKALARNADIFVNDAFGTAHRAHASTEGVASFLRPAVAGFLLQKELDYLQGAVDVPKRPFAAIVGGSKVSSKISVIEAMLSKVDKLVLGGGMVFTFLKARGVSVGKSLVEDDQLDLARRLETIAKDKGVQLFLASDVVVAEKFAADSANQVRACLCVSAFVRLSSSPGVLFLQLTRPRIGPQTS